MEKWTSNFEKISAIVSDNRLEIKSGDKKYIFNNSLLPEKIQINDVNILSKPVELNMPNTLELWKIWFSIMYRILKIHL